MSHQEPAADNLNDEAYVWDGTENLQRNNKITHVLVFTTKLPRSAFRGCGNLETVKLPFLIRIDADCFCYCKSLKTINLPNSLKLIGRSAFAYSGLEEIQIPPRVNHIEYGVFGCCQFLVHVTMHENLTIIGQYSFRSCSALKNVQLPSSLQEIGNWAFNRCGLVGPIRLPTNVSLGEGAFQDCNHLKEIIFPLSMGRIQNHIFVGCTSICELDLPNIVTDRMGPTFHAAKQKLLTELCRIDDDGFSAMDRLGIDRVLRDRVLFERDRTGNNERYCIARKPKSTLQMTCLFSFLKRNSHDIFKNVRQAPFKTEGMETME